MDRETEHPTSLTEAEESDPIDLRDWRDETLWGRLINWVWERF